MTLNEVNIIKNSVLDATEAYVDARLNSSDFVKTQIGVVTASAKGADNKYRHTVVCNRITGISAGVTYTNVLSVGNIRFPNDSVVFIIIPNAQASNQFILGKLDTSPCNIEGGEIHIGKIDNTDPVQYYFNVNSTGNVTIKGADSSIQLAQDGNTNYYHVNLNKDGIKLGHTTGNNYNFTVNASNGNVTIKGADSSIQLAQDGNTNYYHVNLNKDGIKLGHTTGNNYNFTVNASTGNVTIKNGSILLGETTPSGGNTGYNVDINSTGLGLGWTGNRHNFSVSSSGVVIIYDGTIQMGYKTSSYIPNTYRYDVQLNSGGLNLGAYVKDNGESANPRYSWDYKFSVNNNGYLVSTSGKIGGADIYNDHLQYSDNSIFSRDRIGCGYAGKGIVNLVGNTSDGRAYIALTNSGDYQDFKDGTVIYGIKGSGDDVERGVVRIYNGSGSQIAERYLINIPDGDIDTIIDDRLRHYDLI